MHRARAIRKRHAEIISDEGTFKCQIGANLAVAECGRIAPPGTTGGDPNIRYDHFRARFRTVPIMITNGYLVFNKAVEGAGAVGGTCKAGEAGCVPKGIMRGRLAVRIMTAPARFWPTSSYNLTIVRSSSFYVFSIACSKIPGLLRTNYSPGRDLRPRNRIPHSCHDGELAFFSLRQITHSNIEPKERLRLRY